MPTEKWRKTHKYEMRKYRRKWYQNNKEHAKNKVSERRSKTEKWLRNYKKTLCCEKCGESDWVCLDFHHRNPKEKDCTIGSMHNAAIETIKKEIKKCIVLCSNCHRKLHYKLKMKKLRLKK